MARVSGQVVASLQHRSAQDWPFRWKTSFSGKTEVYCGQVIYFLVNGFKAGIAVTNWPEKRRK
jgi:hypothetical protein